MSETALAEGAYTQNAQWTATPKSIEYKLFARVTRQLEAVKERSGKDFARMAQAIYDNKKLWTALAADLADKGNGLPGELRSKLLYLFEFTRQHSRKVMQGDAGVDVLIDINTAVMRGIKGDIGQQEAAS